ncbi:MAG: cytochrome c biogenesis protein CcdA [Rhodobacteraceae bacterium]|nr:cytochrome c biogenesis protein CcdA [Paracoccaceae bacterium]
MEFLLAYAAGLLTLTNPCVLPVLPIVLATSLQAGRHGPAAVAAGMSVSFVVFGMIVATLGYAIGLDERMVADAGAVLMVAFGLVLVVPRLSAGFATATAGLSTRADAGMDGLERTGLRGQFAGGLLLGAVWSPCIGPTLGGAIAMAAQGENLVRAGAIMTAFALGVSTILLALGYGAREAIRGRQALMRRLAERSRPILGVAFLVVGVAILTRFTHVLEAWALGAMPVWLVDLSVAL